MSVQSLLFTLPTDLLPTIFSFLFPKELCCLDSAILNHTDRPIFLSTLIQSFKNGSYFGAHKYQSSYLESMARWYICRQIPITILKLYGLTCPKGLIAMNCNYLEEISLLEVNLHSEDDLGRCVHLRILTFGLCQLPPICVRRSGSNDICDLPGCCLSLNSLKLTCIAGLRDEELRILVENCHALNSLSLSGLDTITVTSVGMLLNHRPRIPSVGIYACQRLSWDIIISLLREITIPTILDDALDEDLRTSAIMNLSFSFPRSSSTDSHFIDLLSHDSLLEQLIQLLSVKNKVRQKILTLLVDRMSHEHPHLIFEARAAHTIVLNFHSFNDEEKVQAVRLLYFLSDTPKYRQHLLSCGVLSLFRTHLLTVTT
jgi:hypothetical protein